MTPIQLYKFLDQLRLEYSKRRTFRKVVAHWCGFVAFTLSLLPAFLFYSRIPDAILQIYAGVALAHGIGCWWLVVSLLDEKGPLYLANVANNFFYGSKAAKLDILGFEMDLDYALNNPAMRTGLMFCAAIDDGLSVKFRDDEIVRLLPLMISGSANPKTNTIWMRGKSGGYQLGPSWFMENLDKFEIRPSSVAASIRGDVWIERYSAEFLGRIPDVLARWYIGAARSLEHVTL